MCFVDSSISYDDLCSIIERLQNWAKESDKQVTLFVFGDLDLYSTLDRAVNVYGFSKIHQINVVPEKGVWSRSELFENNSYSIFMTFWTPSGVAEKNFSQRKGNVFIYCKSYF